LLRKESNLASACSSQIEVINATLQRKSQMFDCVIDRALLHQGEDKVRVAGEADADWNWIWSTPIGPKAISKPPITLIYAD
jgi:hypothetical protein